MKMPNTRIFLLMGLLLSGASLMVRSQTPTSPPKVLPTQAPRQQKVPQELLKLKAGQEPLNSQWMNDTSAVVAYREKTIRAPYDLEQRYPKGTSVRPADWWQIYSVELRRVGVAPKLLLQRRMVVYKSDALPDRPVCVGFHAYMDSKSVVVSYLQADLISSSNIAQYCLLTGPPVVDLDSDKTTLYAGIGWRQRGASASIRKAKPPVEGEWVADVSDGTGAKSQWHFKAGKWRQTVPFTPAPTLSPVEIARRAQAARIEERTKERMLSYRTFRELGQTREEAIVTTRKLYKEKAWLPRREAWDTLDFDPPKPWLTPQPTVTPIERPNG